MRFGLPLFALAAALGCDGSNVVGQRPVDATLPDTPEPDVVEDHPDVPTPTFDLPPAPDVSMDALDAGDVADAAMCTLPPPDAPDDRPDAAPPPDADDAGDAGGPTPVTFVEAASANPGFTCVTMTSGQARCVGDNNLGQLGDGTAMGRTRPVVVSGLFNARQVSAGSVFACGLVDNGTVRCWGANSFGQLGDGSTSDHRTAMPVTGVASAAQLSLGQSHACALLGDGAVTCWGRNADGQVGNGAMSMAPQTTPAPVTGLTGARQVDLGGNFSCALLGDGSARCWGANGNGQLGDGTTTARTLPVAVRNLACALRLSAGDTHACAVLGDGTVRCWGSGLVGQLGDGTNTPTATFLVQVAGVANAVDVSAGAQHTCAVLRDGSVRCWGSNMFGQLGNDSAAPASNVPVNVAGVANAVQVSAGARHTCARLTDGSVRCWGSNASGQLGDGMTSTEPRRSPVTMVF